MEPSILRALGPLQAQVVLRLAAGDSITTAARITGIGRTTVYDWLKNEPNFSAAVEYVQCEFAGDLHDQLHDLTVKALANLNAILDDTAAPAGVRLKAALAILNRPHFAQHGWDLPAHNGTHHQEARGNTPEIQLNIEQKQAEDEVQHLPTPTPVRTVPNTSEHISANSQPVHQPVHQPPANEANSAPSEPHRPAVSNKVGRNHPCPCGSQRKFKRCCLNQPHPAAAGHLPSALEPAASAMFK